MKTLSLLALFGVLGVASSGLAQQAAPLPCYRLQDPANQCVVAAQGVVNFAQPAFNFIDLNGAWRDQGGHSLYIYLYGDSYASSGYSFSVDMSLVNRPDGIGYIVDGKTIYVWFPDDSAYTGKIEANGTRIRWSNNTIWTKQ